ncbi:MAG: hypothetical protein HN742_23400 [Lentisphaerae bacterium]|jgi:hypothetical protein|nr:hypothetical protein [Lentisphaerota bacterium]MBT4819022.1 hypothetical protein [Lentisphaerota bacterium]MBT5605174.1 hypothetical protein [Lentisphaerota bacterium]MBT7054374.1 hypothetical protein [Lentisphaerota bacterium]MBT7844842.1 hypothetical protein [Lentisphaerota bacterium]
MKAQYVREAGWRPLLLTVVVIAMIAPTTRAAWHWWEWPNKDVVFQGFGSYDQVRLGQWVAKTPNVTITFTEDEDDRAIQVLIHVPRIGLTAEQEQQRIDEDMKGLLTNILPHWDGAYDSLRSLWRHYEANKQPLPLYFNQFEITYTSTQKQRTVLFESRKGFDFRRRKSEVTRRRTGEE